MKDMQIWQSGTWRLGKQDRDRQRQNDIQDELACQVSSISSVESDLSLSARCQRGPNNIPGEEIPHRCLRSPATFEPQPGCPS